MLFDEFYICGKYLLLNIDSCMNKMSHSHRLWHFHHGGHIPHVRISPIRALEYTASVCL